MPPDYLIRVAGRPSRARRRASPTSPTSPACRCARAPAAPSSTTSTTTAASTSSSPAWGRATRCASTATRAAAGSRTSPSGRACSARPAASTSRTPTTTTTAGSTSSCIAAAGNIRCATRCCATTSDGTFTDVTAKAGLLDKRPHRTHTAAWADYDNDGWVDLFVGHEESPSALYHNERDGTFREVGAAAGVARTAFTKGATWGDYDNDGFADLYVSNYAGRNFLFHNRKDGTFDEVAQPLGVDLPLMSFATWFFDYDNDGWLDLFVASFVPSVTEVVRGVMGLPPQAETMRLYRNNRRGGFEDVTAAIGLARVVPAMGANFGDIDNDGFLDMYIGTGAPSYAALVPNVMFRNDGGRRFVDVTAASGTGHLQKGHGVAFGDVDGDGDDDLLANMGGFVPGDAYWKALFRNPGTANRSLGVRLVGTKSNRAAIGARITAFVRQPDGTLAERHRVVTSGGSFGASPYLQRIGLGPAASVERLDVLWPASGLRQSLHRRSPPARRSRSARTPRRYRRLDGSAAIRCDKVEACARASDHRLHARRLRGRAWATAQFSVSAGGRPPAAARARTRRRPKPTRVRSAAPPAIDIPRRTSFRGRSGGKRSPR